MTNAIDMSWNTIIRLLMFLYLLLVIMSTGDAFHADIYSDTFESQRPLDCYAANETCFNSVACRNSLLVLYQFCGRSWKYCDTKKVSFCSSHLEYVREKTNFKGCVCYDNTPRYRHCDNLWKLLNHNPCEMSPIPTRPPGAPKDDLVVDKNGRYADMGQSVIKKESKPEEPKKQQTKMETIKQQLEKVGVKPDTGEGPSCLEVIKRCRSIPQCEAARNDFIKNCQFDICDNNSDRCLDTYENIRKYSVFKCTCQNVPRLRPGDYQECRHFRSQFVENKCLALMNSQTLYGFNINKKNGQQPKAVPDSSPDGGRVVVEPARPPDIPAVSKPKPRVKKAKPDNCFTVYSECVRDSDCLTSLVNISEHCFKDETLGSQCRDRRKCLKSLEHFYTYLVRYARRAVVCDCNARDRDCIAKRTLFRPPCAYEEHSDTCLDMLENKCNKDSDCKNRFHLFYEYCAHGSDQTCKHSPTKCFDAYRTLWGTNLTQQCTCRMTMVPAKHGNRTGRYLNVCRQLKKFFLNPPCLQGLYDITPKRSTYALPKRNDRQTIDKRKRKACRKRLESGVREATIRLYHNDSCSDLCQCTGRHEVRCRVLPCIDSKPCRYMPGSSKCQCVLGELICPPSDLVHLNSPPGIYINLGFSPNEHQLLRHHTGGPDLANLSQDLTWVLNSTTGGGSRLCQLQLQSKTSSSALYRVRLVQKRTTDTRTSVADACRYPIRLLKLMIDSGDPAIRTHPRLSLMRQVRVLDSSTSPDSSTTYEEIRPNGRRRLPNPGRTHMTNVNYNVAMRELGDIRLSVLLLLCLAWLR